MRKTDVVGRHSEFFKANGFVLNPTQLLFEKVFPHGKQVIYVHFMQGSQESYLEYHLAIRINEVEELVQKYLPTPNNYPGHSITLAQTPDKLGHAYPKKITVLNDKELTQVVRDFEIFFSKKGFEWLDQMINPSVLEQEFLFHKETPFEEFNLEESAFRSIALSKLYNPNDYPILRQSYLEKINSREMTPFTIASFLHFLNYLDKLEQVAA